MINIRACRCRCINYVSDLAGEILRIGNLIRGVFRAVDGEMAQRGRRRTHLRAGRPNYCRRDDAALRLLRVVGSQGSPTFRALAPSGGSRVLRRLQHLGGDVDHRRVFLPRPDPRQGPNGPWIEPGRVDVTHDRRVRPAHSESLAANRVDDCVHARRNGTRRCGDSVVVR